MQWTEIVVTLAGVVATLGGWEAVKYLINRKQNARKAKAEADVAEDDAERNKARSPIEVATEQFALLKDVTEFLQQQLKEKEERFAEQTEHVRELNKELLDAKKEAANAKIEALTMRCEVPQCAGRKPPTGY